MIDYFRPVIVDTIYPNNNGAFTAKMTVGAVISWGTKNFGGIIPEEFRGSYNR